MKQETIQPVTVNFPSGALGTVTFKRTTPRIPLYHEGKKKPTRVNALVTILKVKGSLPGARVVTYQSPKDQKDNLIAAKRLAFERLCEELTWLRDDKKDRTALVQAMLHEVFRRMEYKRRMKNIDLFVRRIRSFWQKNHKMTAVEMVERMALGAHDDASLLKTLAVHQPQAKRKRTSKKRRRGTPREREASAVTA